MTAKFVSYRNMFRLSHRRRCFPLTNKKSKTLTTQRFHELATQLVGSPITELIGLSPEIHNPTRNVALSNSAKRETTHDLIKNHWLQLHTDCAQYHYFTYYLGEKRYLSQQKQMRPLVVAAASLAEYR